MIFFLKQTCHSQTGGRGGVPHLGKIPTFSRFFIWGASLTLCKQYTAKYIELTFFVILSFNHNENAHLSLDFSLQGFPCTLSFAQLYVH